MKDINVAFCLRDMQMGGVESVLIRTLDELQKHKNIHISLITYVDIHENVYKKYLEKHPQIKQYSLYPSKWLTTKLPHFFLSRICIHFLRDIYRNFKRFVFGMRKFKDIDVFIDYHDFGFANELKHIKSAQKVAWFHSSLSVFKKRKFEKKLKYYDNLVVLTDECMHDFRILYPQFSNKIVRIYNPIDIKDIKNKSKEQNKVSGKYFCTVARLTPDKDIETVLRAFDLFWQKNKKTNVKMVFVGDGNRAKHYISIANTLSSKKQFIFTGALSNPFSVMKRAVANVLSSYGEGLPTVLIESVAVGTLNIASSCKYGPREILLNGRGGLLYEPGDVEQLAKHFDSVYNKKVNVKNMIQESSKSLNRFDAKQIVKQIISLIS